MHKHTVRSFRHWSCLLYTSVHEKGVLLCLSRDLYVSVGQIPAWTLTKHSPQKHNNDTHDLHFDTHDLRFAWQVKAQSLHTNSSTTQTLGSLLPESGLKMWLVPCNPILSQWCIHPSQSQVFILAGGHVKDKGRSAHGTSILYLWVKAQQLKDMNAHTLKDGCGARDFILPHPDVLDTARPNKHSSNDSRLNSLTWMEH